MQLNYTITHQKENLSHSGQLDELFFHSHTHVSFPKANGTCHEKFHSISSAANFLPDMKKCTVLKCSTGCHSHLSPPAQLSTTLKTEGDPREAADKIPFHLVSILFFQSIFYHLTLSHTIPMRYGRASMFTSFFE